MITHLAAVLAAVVPVLHRGRHARPAATSAELAHDEAAREEAWQREVVAPGTPDELLDGEISDREFQSAIAAAVAVYGKIPPSLQKVLDRGGRFGRPSPRCPECVGQPGGPCRAECITPAASRPPAEFAPLAEPVTVEPPLAPLPAPVVDWRPRPGVAARVPVTILEPEPPTLVDLPAVPGRAVLRDHVARVLAGPARSSLAQWVDQVMARPYTGWSDSTGSFAAVVAGA